MKRFTETLKWQDPWFRCLSAEAKLLWLYMTDHCDNIGLVEINWKLTSMDCGLPIKEAHAAELGDRIQRIGDSKFFIRGFIPFQYGSLSEACIPHRKVIEGVRLHSLTPTFKGYIYPNARVSTGVSYTPMYKEEDKDKEKEDDKDTHSKRAKGSLDELMEFCKASGLFPRDAEHCFYKWEGNGWTNGKAKIKDWKSTIRAWKAAGYLPSQREPSPADCWPEPKCEREPEPDLMAVLQENIAKRKAREAEENAEPAQEVDPQWS